MTTTGTDLDYWTIKGHDRDAAYAMLSQSRLPNASRIDDIQVQHLLRIGYSAGRRITEDDQAFGREDRRLTRLLTFLGGAAFGVALAAVAVWVAS